MDRLADELWATCVNRRAAKDDETIERWQTDEVAHLIEGFYIENMHNQPTSGKPMSAYIQPHLDRIVPQWLKLEEKLFEHLRMDREEFLNRFEETRQRFLNNDDKWQQFVRLTTPIVYGVVRNMEWVNAFAWILPKADPTNSEQHRRIGRVMAALFYIELLSKHGGTTGSNDNRYLHMIEARWQIANQKDEVVKA